jgi:hypothetical protein
VRDDLAAFGGERPRRRAADSAGCAGDENALSGEPEVHGGTLRTFTRSTHTNRPKPKLLAQGRFLEDRFGRNDALGLPVDTP